MQLASCGQLVFDASLNTWGKQNSRKKQEAFKRNQTATQMQECLEPFFLVMWQLHMDSVMIGVLKQSEQENQVTDLDVESNSDMNGIVAAKAGYLVTVTIRGHEITKGRKIQTALPKDVAS